MPHFERLEELQLTLEHFGLELTTPQESKPKPDSAEQHAALRSAFLRGEL